LCYHGPFIFFAFWRFFVSKKLYVGGLAYAVDDATLESLFAQVGVVASAKVIKDFQTGRSKGFGFVEMSTPQEAAEAIQKLNGSTHEGRTIIVSEAKPQENGGRRGGNGGRGGFGGDRDRDRGGRGGFGGDRDRGGRDRY
jgi:RNA recognition motif-containing protein